MKDNIIIKLNQVQYHSQKFMKRHLLCFVKKDNIEFIEGDILKYSFKDILKANDRLIFYIDVHDNVAPLMDYIIENIFRFLIYFLI